MTSRPVILFNRELAKQKVKNCVYLVKKKVFISNDYVFFEQRLSYSSFNRDIFLKPNLLF